MEPEVIENHERYAARKELFKSFGCDVDRERRFILEQAGPLTGMILEAGTGKGHFAIALAQAGYKFVTFDVSPDEQRFARLNLRYYGLDTHVDFRIENGERLTFADGSFDAVFSVNTIHHLEEPYAVIDELIRVLAAGGKLVLSDFTEEGFRLIERIHASEGRAHEKGGAALDDIRAYVADKGFSVTGAETRLQSVIIARKGEQP